MGRGGEILYAHVLRKEKKKERQETGKRGEK